MPLPRSFARWLVRHFGQGAPKMAGDESAVLFVASVGAGGGRSEEDASRLQWRIPAVFLIGCQVGRTTSTPPPLPCEALCGDGKAVTCGAWPRNSEALLSSAGQ